MIITQNIARYMALALFVSAGNVFASAELSNSEMNEIKEYCNQLYGAAEGDGSSLQSETISYCIEEEQARRLQEREEASPNQ